MKDSSKALKGIKKGRLTRAFELSKLAAGYGRRFVAEKAKALATDARMDLRLTNARSVELAEEMLETFSEMKGLAMKLGQMLSYLEDLLPPEAQKILIKLQRDAEPVPYEEIRALFIEEMGAPPEERFASFDPTPIAAASIGQVHRAELPDGRVVAVKIQYPGIAEAMSADLKNAKMFGLFQRVFFFRTNTTAIMAELEERLLDECDYRKEADYQERFGRIFAKHPIIVVPEVHREHSSRRVLTTTFYEGRSFYDWLEGEPPEEARRSVMATFYRFYLGTLYLHALFNCDPHPGNYLFLDDGRIVFLDYGCVREFPEERCRLWVEMCKAVVADDEERIETFARQVGFIPESVKEYDHEAFRRLMRYIYAPYLEDRPYSFRDHPPQQTFREMFLENTNLFKMDMPADAVFLNRITFGLVSLMTDLGSEINVYRLANAYFEGRDPLWDHQPPST
jgi:predicted unusual protein kinase regulating ubiquinone biosynthesis (AarF/ABC1/UbiB family)